jgi:hypothetical protein
MTEKELLIDTLRRLNRIEIPYMLTGSMASNYWGIPRTTHDLDYVVQMPEAAIRQIIEAFRGDFYIEEEAVRAAYYPPHQFNAVDTRSALKVDFWLLQPRPFERCMFDRRIKIELFGEAAWLCTAEDVILHKLYWNGISPSERQLGDAAGVVAVQRGTLDAAYLDRWAAKLDVVDVLHDLLTGRIGPKQT